MFAAESNSSTVFNVWVLSEKQNFRFTCLSVCVPVRLLLICFGIVCIIFSQLCYVFVPFKWCLLGSDSISLFSVCFFFLFVIRIYYKYPVEAKKREISPTFFFVSLEPTPFLYRHLLGEIICVCFIIYSVKIRKQDGFVCVCVISFVCVLWFVYQNSLKRKIGNCFSSR